MSHTAKSIGKFCTIVSVLMHSICPALAEKEYVLVNQKDLHPTESVRAYFSSLRSAIENNWCQSAPHKNPLSVYFAVDANGNLQAMEVMQSSGTQSEDNAALEAISKCFLTDNAVRELKVPLKLDIHFKPLGENSNANTNELSIANEKENAIANSNENENPAADEHSTVKQIPWDKLTTMQSPHLSPLIQLESRPKESANSAGASATPGTPEVTKTLGNPGQIQPTESSKQIQPAEELFTLAQARTYMLSLVNRDRATKHLKPVELDDVACRAAQYHSDTMAKLQFNSHWHPDGKKPPQRYFDLGGFDYSGENSHGSGSNMDFLFRVPDQQLFTKSEIEAEEGCYFNEKPPNDGHHKQILDPPHTHVGLGMTLVEFRHDGSNQIHRQVTSSQEFINKYAGNYFESARGLHRGTTYVLTGQLAPGVTMSSAMLLREDAPQPIPQNILQDRTQPKFHGGYTLPDEHVLSVFTTPNSYTREARLYTQGQMFRCEITPGANWKSGLYYLNLFADINGSGKKAHPFSMRTLILE